MWGHADDWFVIAISDANFARYQITADELQRAMDRNPKVHTALICIGEGAEASWFVILPIYHLKIKLLTRE